MPCNQNACSRKKCGLDQENHEWEAESITKKSEKQKFWLSATKTFTIQTGMNKSKDVRVKTPV
jgi:hypothetical protein